LSATLRNGSEALRCGDIAFETRDKSLTVLRMAEGERIALTLNTEALQLDVTKG
jgi:hypothetical protein